MEDRTMYHRLVRVCTALVVSFACLCAATANAQDPVKVDPQHFKVLFENQDIRVIEVRVEAGGKVPSHSHPSGFAYALSSFKAKTALPDGSTVVGEYRVGQFNETKPVTHMEENTGATLAHLLLIEFKTR
jgi:hypothetical protein